MRTSQAMVGSIFRNNMACELKPLRLVSQLSGLSVAGARSTDDLLSSQNPSNNSSPQISSRSDKYGNSSGSTVTDRVGGSGDVPYRSTSHKLDQSECYELLF